MAINRARRRLYSGFKTRGVSGLRGAVFVGRTVFLAVDLADVLGAALECGLVAVLRARLDRLEPVLPV